MAKLNIATNLLVTARTESETEARETAFAASKLVGEVEAKVSLLGSIKIDSDTGAIIDIDWSEDLNSNKETTIDCDQIPSTMGPESLAWQAQCGGGSDSSKDAKPAPYLDTGVEIDLETRVNGSADGGVDGSIRTNTGLSL
jgi:hypothetical protein